MENGWLDFQLFKQESSACIPRKDRLLQASLQHKHILTRIFLTHIYPNSISVVILANFSRTSTILYPSTIPDAGVGASLRKMLYTEEIKHKAECRSRPQQSGNKVFATAKNLRITCCWLDIYGCCHVNFAGLCSRAPDGSLGQPFDHHSALRPACLSRIHTPSVTLSGEFTSMLVLRLGSVSEVTAVLWRLEKSHRVTAVTASGVLEDSAHLWLSNKVTS